MENQHIKHMQINVKINTPMCNSLYLISFFHSYYNLGMTLPVDIPIMYITIIEHTS